MSIELIAVRRATTRRRPIQSLVIAAVVLLGVTSIRGAATGDATQARMSADLAAGRPIVVHVIVALCDNENQGIVPVPTHLGNGQDPGSNLYWGAAYGVRSFLTRQGGWVRVSVEKPESREIRERLVLFKRIVRGSSTAPVYIVADAWDGAAMKPALEEFLRIASAAEIERVPVRASSTSETLSAGGGAHLVAFVGHNGLMDVTVADRAETEPRAVASSSVVLACASKPYFLERLLKAGSHPLLLTTGLMAPESYTLNAAIASWVQGDSVSAVRAAAAVAYDRYQHCGRNAAKNLFWGQEP